MSEALRTSLVAAFVRTQRWMLDRPIADAMVEVINQHRLGIKTPADELERIVAGREQRRERMQREYDGLGMVAGVRGVDGREPYLRISGDGGAPGSIVPIHGLLCKNADSINGMSQPQGMTWDQAAEAMTQGYNDPQSRWVIADIYSPGGSVAGAEDFCQRVRSLTKTGDKPVVALAHDHCCSGGYFAACMCDEIYATEQANVGSIASYFVVEDSSEYYAKLGIKRMVIAGGASFKGAGQEDGVAISDEQLRDMERNADETTAWFVRRALVEGRGMDQEKAAKLGDGRVWSGREAVALGLIDGTTTLAELVAQMRKAAA